MKTLKLKELTELMSKSDAKYYCSEISTWSDTQKAKLEKLSNLLLSKGAKSPIPWAYSEVSENIPQFGRFLILKNLFAIINDPNSVVVEAAEFDEDIQKKINVVSDVLGEEYLNQLLHAYGKAIISGVISILDEGNYNAKKDNVSWHIAETDGSGKATGRIIQGLHEDFYDFEE